ncbi:MAG: hypothetical protein AAF943_16105 [Pseudomonadota bacterium]
MTRVAPFAYVLMITAAAGCTQFPELEGALTRDFSAAAYPDLLPIEPLLARSAISATDPLADQTLLNARLAALRAKAQKMRGSVLDGAARQRLENGLR